MGTVYFTRHGQTVWNVENKICGATDSPLTDLGHEQAIELGKKILEEGIQIDEILDKSELFDATEERKLQHFMYLRLQEYQRAKR